MSEESVIWKWVEGFEGVYQVNNFGGIMSFAQTNRQGAILKPNFDKYGYLKISLRKNKKPVHFTVHRMVAEAFIPNPDEKPQINHMNAEKTDNRVSNLEWVTSKENMHHSFKTGCNKRTTVRKVKAVNLISGETFVFSSQREASQGTGVMQTTISYHLRGKTAKDTRRYSFMYIDIE